MPHDNCKCSECCPPPAPCHPCCLPIACTKVCGRIVAPDLKPKAKVPVTVRLAQVPLVIGGAGITNEVLTAETDGDGVFEFTLPTGATVCVQIPALQYNKNFVVPPPADPSIPVRLLSL